MSCASSVTREKILVTGSKLIGLLYLDQGERSLGQSKKKKDIENQYRPPVGAVFLPIFRLSGSF